MRATTALLALGLLITSLGCGGYTITKVDEEPVVSTTGSGGTRAAPARKTGNGQIQVYTAAAVQAIVDGVPMEFDVNQGYVGDYPAGSHTLEIRNLLGKKTASQTVNVKSGSRHRFTYKKKALTSDGVVASTELAAPAPVVSVSRPTAAATGSAQVEGLSAYSDKVWIDGVSVGYDNSNNGFVGRGLTAGAHTIRVERAGQVLYDGPLAIEGGQNHRCLATYQNFKWQLDCHWTKPAL